MNRLRIIVVWVGILLAGSGSTCTSWLMADEGLPAEMPLRSTLHAGLSNYTGILGVELNKGHWALTLGLPTSVGVRYYIDPRGQNWFVGANASYFSYDEDEYKYGVHYTSQSHTLAGAGLGYTWRWPNRWNLTFSMSSSYYGRTLKNDTDRHRDVYFVTVPELSLGYTF